MSSTTVVLYMIIHTIFCYLFCVKIKHHMTVWLPWNRSGFHSVIGRRDHQEAEEGRKMSFQRIPIEQKIWPSFSDSVSGDYRVLPLRLEMCCSYQTWDWVFLSHNNASPPNLCHLPRRLIHPVPNLLRARTKPPSSTLSLSLWAAQSMALGADHLARQNGNMSGGGHFH